jgi:hypothetical protein
LATICKWAANEKQGRGTEEITQSLPVNKKQEKIYQVHSGYIFTAISFCINQENLYV